MNLWERLIHLIKQHDNETLKHIISNTVTFIEKIDVPDNKTIGLFAEATAMANSNTTIYNLIESIRNKCAHHYNHGYAELLFQLLSNSRLNLAYDFGTINELLNIIYSNDTDIDFANKIAELSVERMNFDSVKIYNRFNPISA